MIDAGLQDFRQEKKSVQMYTFHKKPATGFELTLALPLYTAACLDTTDKIMDWVDAPVKTADITIRTGDGAPSEDPTTFTPGEILTLHVRVLKFHMKW